MKQLIQSYILLAALAQLSACSTDVADSNADSNGKKVRLTLNLESADHATTTRSNAYNSEGDLIRNAYVVMVNQGTGKVEHLFHVTDTDEFERKQVTTIDATMNATYDFYNLANFSDFAATTASDGTITSVSTNGLTFTQGEDVPSGLTNASYNAEFTNYTLPTTGIPMTNQETFLVDKDQTITLTLFRMLGKVQFTFNNISDKDIRICKIVMGDLTANQSATTNSQIYFLPKKANGLIYCDFGNLPHDTTEATLFTCGDDKEQAVTISAETGQQVFGSTSAPIYLNESLPANGHQGFPLTIEMDRKNESGTWEPDNREAVVQLDELKRNYVALVNVNLSSYVLKLSANSYPPIGGYPAHVIEENGEFYVNFTGGGDFEITPRLYKYANRNNPELWIDLNDTKQVQSYSLLVTGTTSIFSKLPEFNTTTGEILGTIIPGKTGTATAKLTVNILTGTSATGTAITQTYTRTIYIVAK